MLFLPNPLGGDYRINAEPPAISTGTLRITIWLLQGVTFCFLPVRFYARWKAFKHFYCDDVLVIFSWILLLIVTIVCHIFADAMYNTSETTIAGLSPEPQIALWTEQSGRSGLAVILLSITSLWSIKISFLLFFKRLGVDKFRSLHIHWWAVTVLTVLCYFANFPHLDYGCMAGSFETILARECYKRCVTSVFGHRFNSGLDVVTDLLIVSIPFAILWGIRISKLKKAALMGLFSLVIFTISFSLIRINVIAGRKTLKQYDTMWMSMWSVIEMSVAIIVACLGSFRVLFTASARASDTALCRPETSQQLSLRQTRDCVPKERFASAPSFSPNELRYLPLPSPESGAGLRLEFRGLYRLLFPPQAHLRA